MKARQEKVVQEREQELAKKQLEAERERQRAIDAKQAKKDRQKKQVRLLPGSESSAVLGGSSQGIVQLVMSGHLLCVFFYWTRHYTCVMLLG